MREVTDGSWHGEVVSRILGRSSGLLPSDLDEDLLERRVAEAYSSFVISVEEYQDAGTDNKESFSLEPCLLSTGLLKSEFNGDHRSRLSLGISPVF
jgi:hypothetical protein